MKRNKLWFFSCVLLFSLAFTSEAQTGKTKKPVKKTETQKTTKKAPAKKSPAQKSTPPKKKPAAKTNPEKTKAETTEKNLSAEGSSDEQKVRDIVAFLQYMLNTLGSNATSSRDKDVLITQSYSKVFRDEKVQVEDDLDEAREVITYKDVVAYLKDVDFFFTDVKFELNIEDIKSGTMAGGQQFYKVTLSRHLTGTTPEGKSITNTMPRYMEINYNPDDQDLKIASIYTNEFDEKEALTTWWKELSYEWQSVFKRKLNLPDSVQLNDIKNITAIEDLDISNNQYIQSIEPLGQLLSLKLLDLSQTNISDLTPIRNLTELVELNLAGTRVEDLTPLKYSTHLQRLNINHTAVKDISVLEKMSGLQNLEMRSTQVNNFAPLRNLTQLLYLDLKGTPLQLLTSVDSLYQLMELNVASTRIQDINPIKGLKKLVTLTLDSTRIDNFAALGSLTGLKTLHANHTLLVDLKPLEKLTQLEKVYCDQTLIKREAADAFMAANKKVLIIFDTKDIKNWWETLSPEWQLVFSKTARIDYSKEGQGKTPPKEDLAKVTNLDSINLGGNRSVYDLEPLRKLQKLRILIVNKTTVKDLSVLKENREISFLDISDTEVNDLSVVAQFKKLNFLTADRSKIQSIEPLYGLTALRKVYVDQTMVIDINASEFLEQNPECLIVYKTNHLTRWWSNLSRSWKEVFRTQMGNDTTTTRENLHTLAERTTLQFKDAGVNDLSVLREFVRLKELHFSGTAIGNIPALENIRSLRSLHATNSPIQKIESLGFFEDLEELDISNTPVDELRPLSGLQKLKMLNAAGTQIKKLDALERLQSLESLDCSNTKVSNLNPVTGLPLKTLKCYNTKVSDREVKNFKERHPDCNVVYYR
jgi:Leucine-rich repeat (LRR) protein